MTDQHPSENSNLDKTDPAPLFAPFGLPRKIEVQTVGFVAGSNNPQNTLKPKNRQQEIWEIWEI
jgi:hypothetical protein